MGEGRTMLRVVTSRHGGKKPVGRLRRRCTYNVGSDIRGLRVAADREGVWSLRS